MSIRTDDLGFVFYEADEQEEKELEYVYAITDSWNYMGDEVIDTFPRRFWDRVCQEKIKAPFTKEMFLQETDIIATIKGFGLDVNKFWWAVLFVYDWSIEKFTKCFWVKLPPKSLTKILDYIGDSKDFEITFRVKGKKSREADPNVKAAVMYGLRQKLKEWKDKEFYHIIDHSTYTTTFTNSSYYMCFAADKFKHLFDALKLPNRGAANEHRCDKEVSYNKMLLISRLFYFMRLTRNVNFKDSDESLKGVLKTYANKLPHTESAIYGF